MSIRKIRASWWVDFQHNGLRVRQRSPENSKQGASLYEHTLRLRLSRGEPLKHQPAPKPVTFYEYAERWMRDYVLPRNRLTEQIAKKRTLELHLLPWFGSTPISEVTQSQIEEYKRSKLAGGLCAKTINNHLTMLSTALRTAQDDGVLDDLPRIKRLSARAPEIGFLSEDEVQRLMSGLRSEKWRAMVLVAARTGMRFGELTGLQWEDVDFQRQDILVQRARVRGVMGPTKSGRHRLIPMTREVVETLSGMRRASGFVFANETGTPISYGAAANQLLRAAARVGIRRKVNWHLLRHTFASHLVMKDVSLLATRDLLGHTSIQMTTRYAKLAPSKLREAISVLDSATPRQPAVNADAFSRHATKNSP